MHLETDYTNDKLDELTQNQNDRTESLDELEQYLAYFSSQYINKYNPKKLDDMIYIYKELAKLAYVQSGKVTLDISEKKQSATLTYWGLSIVFSGIDCDFSKEILINLLSRYDMIYIEEHNGGIQITVKEILYDRIKINS